MTTTTSKWVRIGAVPTGNSRNHRDGASEIGVSVYPAIWDETGLTIDLSDCTDLVSAVMIIWADKPMYAVDGVEVGKGSDGEPVLDHATVTATKIDPDFNVLFPNGKYCNPSQVERAVKLAASSR